MLSTDRWWTATATGAYSEHDRWYVQKLNITRSCEYCSKVKRASIHIADPLEYLWSEEGFDTISSTFQCYSTEKQHNEDDVGKCSCEVHNLPRIEVQLCFGESCSLSLLPRIEFDPSNIAEADK